MQEPNNQRYINQVELIDRVGVSANTVRTMESEGRFPKRKKFTKRLVRWWLPDVEAWLRDPENWSNTQVK